MMPPGNPRPPGVFLPELDIVLEPSGPVPVRLLCDLLKGAPMSVAAGAASGIVGGKSWCTTFCEHMTN